LFDLIVIIISLNKNIYKNDISKYLLIIRYNTNTYTYTKYSKNHDFIWQKFLTKRPKRKISWRSLLTIVSHLLWWQYMGKFSSRTCPFPVSMLSIHAVKVKIVTITSKGWPAQNWPYFSNTCANIVDDFGKKSFRNLQYTLIHIDYVCFNNLLKEKEKRRI